MHARVVRPISVRSANRLHRSRAGDGGGALAEVVAECVTERVPRARFIDCDGPVTRRA